jgi:hypothetical protein
MRLTRLLGVLVAATALLAVPAAAKEGVRAKLVEPIRLDAAAGETLTVKWRLVDRDGRPFGAGGIYLRISRCGRGPLTVPARESSRGRYSAIVKVPKGGIRALHVGLKGWRTIAGRTERADMRFRFDPPLTRRCS